MAGVKGRSGRPGKSIAEHKRDGTYREDRHGSLMVKPENLAWLDMPVILDHTQSVPKEQIFKTIASYLYKYNQSAQEDEILLGLLVDQIQIYRDAKAIYDAEGATAAIGRKLASTVISDAGREITKLMSEFHLTPNTRVPMNTIEGEVEEEDAETKAINKFAQRLKG